MQLWATQGNSCDAHYLCDEKTNATRKQTMQMKFPENVTINYWLRSTLEMYTGFHDPAHLLDADADAEPDDAERNF